MLSLSLAILWPSIKNSFDMAWDSGKTLTDGTFFVSGATSLPAAGTDPRTKKYQAKFSLSKLKSSCDAKLGQPKLNELPMGSCFEMKNPTAMGPLVLNPSKGFTINSDGG